jgi:hypothetical protein
MAANTQTLTLSATITDAEFRALAQLLANTLESGGVIRTTDTGQVNLSTMTFPGANNTPAGYEIRRFTDSLQASAPIFIKIEYARGGGANFFDVFLTIGTGSDGAGNITGVKFPRTQIGLINNFTSLPCHVSAGTSWFVWYLAANNVSTTSALLSLERSKNGTGADTNRGLYLFTNKSPQQTRFIDVAGVTTPPNDTTNLGCLAPATQTSGLHSSGNVAVYPYYFFGVGETMPPSRNIVGGFRTDFTGGNTYSINIYGQPQTMLKPLTGSFPVTLARGGQPTTLDALIRYE